MVDATTVNILLTVPANGADSGAWDVPVNNNAKSIDGRLGGAVSVALSSSNVTLTGPTGTPTPGTGPTQSENALITFSGTLTANVVITFPTPGFWTVIDNTTGSFYVQLSGGSGNKVGAPRGAPTRVYSDGTNMGYAGLGLVGTYSDLAGSSVPLWFSACTVAPYLACDATAYSRSTYAALYNLVGTSFGTGDGSTTFNVPDLRNRNRYYLNNFGNGASNRITTAGSGVDGTTLGAAGGEETHTLLTAELAAHAHTLTDPGHTHTVGFAKATNFANTGSSTGLNGSGAAVTVTSASGTTGITMANTGSGTAHNNVAPALIAGITLIKT